MREGVSRRNQKSEKNFLCSKKVVFLTDLCRNFNFRVFPSINFNITQINGMIILNLKNILEEMIFHENIQKFENFFFFLSFSFF